ncbi:MAG: aldose 1-epimerase [Casimicrobiaceae bacterium]
MDSLIALTSRRYVAAVSPGLGGSLAYFGTADVQAFDFVRPTPVRAYADQNVRASAGYPLLPYSNRIGNGRFRFEGVDYLLDINSPIPIHPIHGLGWIREWTVASTSANRVELTLGHITTGAADRAWPWSFTATQTFDLDDDRLQWSLTLTNRDTRPMPAGIGMHPFFPKPPQTEVQFATKAVWHNDVRMLPTTRTEVVPEWDFKSLRQVGDLAVDNCFAGWSRTAQIVWPDRGYSLAIEASEVLGHLVVFTSPTRDSIALEPISHANNAVNLAAPFDDTGLVILAPGEMLSGNFTMHPAAI